MRRRVAASSAAVAAVIGLVAATAVTGHTVARKTVHFTETTLGATILQRGSHVESAFKITSSVDGHGAGVAVATIKGTAFPVRLSGTTTAYFANGVGISKDTSTIGAPNAKGISAITGSGKCIGGTGYHKHAKCSYTFKGTYDTKTTISSLKSTGIKSY